jgi:predicted dithiol-disulfide oxidoreductase (DUF899 family)
MPGMSDDARFPGEPSEYRAARDRLLHAEIDLRRSVEAVAAARRALPPGAPVPVDYAFTEARPTAGRTVHMSEVLAPGQDTLILYGLMYGPAMDHPCSSCTSIVDSLDGAARQLASSRVSLAVVAASPADRLAELAQRRGWRHIRLLSSAGTDYGRDYLTEDEKGEQWPMLNVFRRFADDDGLRHFWGSELLFGPDDPGQDGRHVDMIWPIWNLFDLTPAGRPSDEEWNPTLDT